MIIDSLENMDKYTPLNPYFKRAFEFIRSLDFDNLELGTTQIEGDDLYITVSDAQLKEEEDALLEAHNKYIDIQIPLSAPEVQGWRSRNDCISVHTPYSSEKDIEFYTDVPSSFVMLFPSEFSIFFPEDAHAPCIGVGKVKKIVVKVRV